MKIQREIDKFEDSNMKYEIYNKIYNKYIIKFENMKYIIINININIIRKIIKIVGENSKGNR